MSNLLEEPINEIEVPLKNYIHGTNFSIFESNTNYYSMDNDSIISSKVYKNSDVIEDYNLNEMNEMSSSINFNYFMKNYDNIKINVNYDNEFLLNLRKNISSNNFSLSNDNVPADVYYHTNIKNMLLNKSFCQKDDNFYFIEKNMFPIDNFINNNYSPEYNTYVQNYVSEHYDKAYFDNSFLNVNDKSLPIYELNEEALSSIQILKFISQDIVDSILEKFDLTDIKDKITYNSKTSSFNTMLYDSISIYPIVEKYKDDTKKLKDFFEFIFSNLSMNSFYRLFIPIGKISTINNDIKENVDTKKLQEYVYYINSNNIDSSSNIINFNYFSLKNLQNPHNEYNYTIENNKNFYSMHTKAFSFDESYKFKMLNYLTETKKDLFKYIDDHHAGMLSSIFIEERELSSTLVDLGVEKYSNWAKTTIENSIKKENSILRAILFNVYFLETYDITLSKDPYLITTNNLVEFLDEKLTNYKNLFKTFEIYNSEFYNLTLNVFSEIVLKIKSIVNDFKPEKMAHDKYYETFLNSQSILMIKKTSLSSTYLELIKKYYPSLVKPLAEHILLKTEENDEQSYLLYDYYKEKYKTRFSSKINDYIGAYDSLFIHENDMKKNGQILGFRWYNKNISINYNNKLAFTYKYYTTFDNNFLKRLNLEDFITMERISLSNINQFVSFNQNLDDLSNELNQDIGYKLNNKYALKLLDNNKINEFNAYLKMLQEIRKFEFLDYFDGFFKYKEADVSKSNVYSLELVNTNLNYELINFESMVALCEKHGYKDLNEETLTFEIVPNNSNMSSFFDVISNLHYDYILDKNENTNSSLLKILNTNIPISEYKFYNKDNKLNENIKEKIEVRYQLENTIRKSIQRYAPINSTLWKIKYSGI